MEFVALQGCLEVVVGVFCVNLSSTPTIHPYIPRAKRPPLYLESFLGMINKRINRTIDKLAPCMTVQRRRTSSSQRSRQSPRSTQRPLTNQRPDSPLFYWPHDYFLFKWRHFWWQEHHRRRSPTWHTRHHARILALSTITVGIARAQSAVNAQNRDLQGQSSIPIRLTYWSTEVPRLASPTLCLTLLSPPRRHLFA